MPGKRGVPHEPTDERRDHVRRGVAAGLTQLQIAAILNISLPTLERHYRRELDTGAAEMVEAVASKLYKTALSDSDSMAATVSRLFIMKARGGWVEKQMVLNADADGSPLGDKPRIVVMLPPNGRDQPAPTWQRPKAITDGQFRDVTPST